MILIGREGCGACKAVASHWSDLEMDFGFRMIDSVDDNLRCEIIAAAAMAGMGVAGYPWVYFPEHKIAFAVTSKGEIIIPVGFVDWIGGMITAAAK